MASRLLVTSALPYANGSIHLGHLVEYIQTDICVRFQRSCGRDVIYLCADDTHGTPIELNAAKAGVTPEAFVARFYEEHQKDFAEFGVSFDTFGSTNSDDNRHYAELIYKRLQDAGDIDRRDIEQTYCERDKRFLPDRFIRGQCPNCGTKDQYGDVCESCGKTYSPTDLVSPRCALCGTPPVRRKSTHLFFRLSKHQAALSTLIRTPGFLHSAVANQLQQFFDKGLADWDISRDGPYFGFRIPGEEDKFFYVWLDAPIGYIATTELWARTTGRAKSALDYWNASSDAEVMHFIGKDIVYFHALFWPAVLGVAGLKKPSRIQVHGHLTVNGQKMSKSRGTMIAARTYLDRLDPSYLRFFYASNLGPGPEDFDLSLNDFRQRVNGELVNNIGNLANRALSLLSASCGGQLAAGADGPGRVLVEAAIARVPEVRRAYEAMEFRQVIRVVVELGNLANQFLQSRAPWALLKTDAAAAQRDLSDAADVSFLLAALLAPVVPQLSEKLAGQFNQRLPTFAQMENLRYPLLDRARALGQPSPLIAKLEQATLDSLILPAAEVPQAPAAQSPTTASPEIEYDDFAKVVLKVGRIVAAEPVPKADKLLKLTVDVGEATPRTIAAGIAQAYAPDALVGRSVVVVANLKPKKLRGIESHGMLLAAGPGGADLKLVDPGPLPPGSEVK
ncbi:MAG: methionine--tRNA ligase [Myxococcaceae bacterium]